MDRAGESGYGWLSEVFVSYQGEGSQVGEKHVFVRFAGCNLRCAYCDTPGSLERLDGCRVDYPGGESCSLTNPLSAAQLDDVLRRICDEDSGVRMIAITGGEPMVQHSFLARWLNELPPPRACLLETNATIATDLERIVPRLELVSADVKLPSNSGEPALWERHRAFLAACAATRVYVKVPVDAGTDPAEVEYAAALIATVSPEATLYLQPITHPQTGSWQIAWEGVEALLGQAASRVADTRCVPQVHKLMGVR
ncbi:MAG: 7-carboxy-7-deazaguanine synthase QueE [Candidatus Binatia bacterium]